MDTQKNNSQNQKDLNKKDIENQQDNTSKDTEQTKEAFTEKDKKQDTTDQQPQRKSKKENIKEDSKQETSQPTEEKTKSKKTKEKSSKTIFTWAFVLLIFFIGFATLCFINKWHIQRQFQAVKTKADSLNYKMVFYKNAYEEKDSLYNILLSKYNRLYTQGLEEDAEFKQNQEELIRLKKLLNTKDSILMAVENAVKEALAGYADDELTVEMKNGKLYVTMREKLLFNSGSDQIPPKGYRALRKLAKVLKKNPNIEILVEGHTDNVPISPKNKKFKDNWDLSVARAVAVVRVLIDKYGIEPERVAAAGRSMYYPIAPNTTAEGRAKNRRIEFILYPNLENLSKIADLEK